MIASLRLRSLLTNAALVLWPFSLPAAVLALPVADATLGTQNTPVATGVVLIEGGTPVGQNLFHSFDSFNIEAEEAAFFASPIDINYIFSRVTGGDISTIDGVLGTVGSNADLFLLNPSGVVFGETASLNVQGSLIVTTADAIALGNNGIFTATDFTSDQLLAVNPSAFFFNGLGQPGEIINRSAVGLIVPIAETLGLVGGDITIDGSQLSAPGGQVTIASISGTGSVAFSLDDNTLIVPDTLARADVAVVNGSLINTAAGDGGDITLYANNLTVSNASEISTGLRFGFGTPTSRSGNIQISATETVTVSAGSSIGNVVLGVGAGGDVTISGRHIRLLNGSQASTIGIGSSDIGDVTLQAAGTIEISSSDLANNGISGILTSAVSLFGFSGQGNSGNINLSAQQIDLADGATLGSSVLSDDTNVAGNSGNIAITTGNLSATTGAVITSSVVGTAVGNAGNIVINASGDVTFEGINQVTQASGGIFSTVQNGAQGDGGDIDISASALEISNGAELNASTFGRGDSGTIRIVADSLLLDGTLRNSFINNDVEIGRAHV